MEDIRNKQLAQNLLCHCVNLKKEENILIEVIGIEGIPLAKELMVQANKIQAKPFFNIIDESLLQALLKQGNEEQIKLYAKYDYKRMKDMNAYIGIRSNSQHTFEGISEKQLEIYQKYYTKPVHFEERVKHTRWCILRYPNEEMAKMYQYSMTELYDFYFKVCNLDYRKMQIAMEPLQNLMSSTDKVHIIGKNTDLTFSMKGIVAQKYFGTFNIPDGEVASAPVKESINGYITYYTTSTYQGITFEDIRFEFKDGKIIKATANDKTQELNQILNIDEGARFIGEFAIGVNPYIEKVVGDTLFDEKVRGSFHLTPGESLQESDNGNRSAIHWDLVCIQTPEYGGGEIWFDDKLIRKDGRFVIKELLPLNPENLIANNEK